MKKLSRSREDRMLFGVCGGVAATYGLNSDLVRAVWLLAGLLGLGAVVYAVAIFLLPEAEPTGEENRVTGARVLGLVLLGVAFVLWIRTAGFDFAVPIFAFWQVGVLLPLAMIVAGSLLLWPRTRAALGFGERKPRRSITDRVLAGVAGGIGQELGIDGNLVRLAFVVAALLTSGFAALLYLLLILVLPEEELPLATAAAGAPEPPPAPSEAPAATGPVQEGPPPPAEDADQAPEEPGR